METLAEHIDREGPMGVRDALGWLTRACKTVSRIHEQGRVHGAICASAIRIADTSCDADGELAHPSDVTVPAAYHAPGRRDDDEPAAHDDVWALACTLYFALTGASPYPHGVRRWIEAGNADAPNIATHGADLSVLQILVEEVLKPTATEDSLPSASMLLVQLSAFSPATAKLDRLPLAMPAGGLAPPKMPSLVPTVPDVDVEIITDVPTSSDLPPLPLLSSLPPAPMRRPPPPPVRRKEPPYKQLFFVTLALLVVAVAALVLNGAL